MDFSEGNYAEPVKYPALELIDLAAEGAAVTERYQNSVINRVNDEAEQALAAGLKLTNKRLPWLSTIGLTP
jgi:hypothetical protein